MNPAMNPTLGQHPLLTVVPCLQCHTEKGVIRAYAPIYVACIFQSNPIWILSLEPRRTTNI